MRIAIIHDWLATWGGGENVLAEVLGLYPEADLYALVDFLPDEYRRRLKGRRARTSFIQRLPFARQHFRKYFPLMRRAIENFDLSEYELVISSSHAVAKGARTTAHQMHICVCYSPARYAWDLREQYLEQAGLSRGLLGWLARAELDRFRRWDLRVSSRVDRFVAISETIARRIRASYGREADVIYPPVSISSHQPPSRGPTADFHHGRAAASAAIFSGLDDTSAVEEPPRGSFYLTVSRLVPYKRVDLLVTAFAAMPDRRLIIVGDGPEMARLTEHAAPNVTLLGQLDDAQRNQLLASARAFVFAAEEDFGIAPLEAQACGTPVIAFGRGGSLETIRGLDTAQPTGVFFDVQSAAAIRAAVEQFEHSATRIDESACRANAQRFSADVFRERFAAYVDGSVAAFGASGTGASG